MKKTLLIILFAFILKAGYCQPYQPFPTSDAVWREVSRQFFMPEVERWDFEYSISGDTLINGVNYHKIVHTGVYEMRHYTSTYTYTYAIGPAAPQSNGYMGALREDSLKHVFFLPPSGADTLLYDFNLAVGDTLPSSFNSSSVVNTVFSIDSVFMDGYYHKRYNITLAGSSSVYTSIIEGMGSTFGLLEKLVPFFEHEDHLACFKRFGSSVYSDTTLNYIYPHFCDLPTSSEEMIRDNVSSDLKIFPNPSDGMVKLSQRAPRELRLIVIDVLGRTVFSLQQDQKDFELDLNNLSPGVYSLKITDAEGVSTTRKLILQ